MMDDHKIQLLSLVEQTEPTPRHIERAEIIKSLIPGGNGGVGAEIGVYKGQMIRPLLDLVSPQKLHLIDPWYLVGKEWNWGDESRSTMRALMAIMAAYEKELNTDKIVLHIGYSFDMLPTFPDGYFDWVYLDTVHRYQHAKSELALLKIKMKETGVIIGDDWYPDPDHQHHGLYQAVREFVETEHYDLIYADVENTQWAIRRQGISG
jgi:SAM-dependent methyltransferase